MRNGRVLSYKDVFTGGPNQKSTTKMHWIDE